MLIGDRDFDFTDGICHDPHLLDYVEQICPDLDSYLAEVCAMAQADKNSLAFEDATFHEGDGTMTLLLKEDVKAFACFDLDSQNVPCNWLIDVQIRPAPYD